MRNPLLCVALFTTTLATLTVQHAVAQSSYGRFGVEASVAASIPVGQYAKKGLSNQLFDVTYQNAKPGLAVDLRPSFYFNEQASVFLQMGISMNARDEKAMEKALLGTSNPLEVAVAVKTDSWNLWKLMPGMAYSFKISEGIVIRPSLAAGVMFTKQPKLEGVIVAGGQFDPNPPSITAFTLAEKKLPTAFAYQVGAAASFQIVKDVIFINANLHYFDAYSNDKLTYTPVFPTPAPEVTVDQKYRFGSVNIGAGIEFRF